MARSHREQKLLRRYRIDEKGFQRILYLQGGGCAICGTDKNLVVDHVDTEHGPQVRGILCRHCNVTLGFARDNEDVLRRLIGYLRRSQP